MSAFRQKRSFRPVSRMSALRQKEPFEKWIFCSAMAAVLAPPSANSFAPIADIHEPSAGLAVPGNTKKPVTFATGSRQKRTFVSLHLVCAIFAPQYMAGWSKPAPAPRHHSAISSMENLANLSNALRSPTLT